MAAWVYIMTNRRNGTLYIGVTSDIGRRAFEHRTGAIDGFTRQYGLKRLVYVETHHTMPLAIEREKRMKTWNRAWKVRLINKDNPEWEDLFPRLMM
jgi:putative endonuclease